MKKYLVLALLPLALVSCGSSQPAPVTESTPSVADFLLYTDTHTGATHDEALALATVTCSELRQGTDIHTVLLGGYAIMGDDAPTVQGPAIKTFCPEYVHMLTDR